MSVIVPFMTTSSCPIHTADADATVELSRVGGVYWASRRQYGVKTLSPNVKLLYCISASNAADHITSPRVASPHFTSPRPSAGFPSSISSFPSQLAAPLRSVPDCPVADAEWHDGMQLRDVTRVLKKNKVSTLRGVFKL